MTSRTKMSAALPSTPFPSAAFRSARLLSAPLLSASLLSAAFLSAGAHAAGYVADPAGSKLEFVGVQAGAEFTGGFHKYTAAIDFAPDALATAHLDVQIDLTSVDSKDKDRDQTIRGSDIFDVAHFPTAHYVTKTITKTATGFSATGSLTLRGVTKDVPIDFQFVSTGPQAKLDGTAKLKRLDFGVGQGDWKSTEWVADAVKINFSLLLKPKP
jgi:polyisoprenoid-binding protein YceI